MNFIQKALISFSGANIELLKKTPTEWNKFIGIGGVVLFTAVFASLSASYALYTIFDDIFLAVCFGIIWGLMIFNLDRYVVSSLKKTGNWKTQFLMAVPRLILAIFLGIIISKPLELKIFEKEIDKQLNTIIERNKAELQKNVSSRVLLQSGPFAEEKKKIQDQINQHQASYDSAVVELEREIMGKEGELTSGKIGYGPNAKRKTELKDQRKKELDEYVKSVQPRLSYLDEQISGVYNNLSTEQKQSEKFENSFNGFAARLQALDELGKASSIMALASLFIMGLFICLEISPILVKLISPVGPYDWMLDNSESIIKVNCKEEITKRELESNFRIDQLKKDLENKTGL